MVMNKRQTRNIAIVLVGFLVITMEGAMWMQHMELEEVRDRWEVKKKVMDDLKTEIGEVEGWIKQFQKQRSDFSARLFSETDIDGLMQDISQCARNNSLSVIDVKKGTFAPLKIPQSSTDEVFIKKTRRTPSARGLESKPASSTSAYIAVMPVVIKVKGRFAPIIKLLECLRSYPRLLNVADIKIQSAQDYPFLNGHIMIHIYRLVTADATGSK